jgi:hypothetical protein
MKKILFILLLSFFAFSCKDTTDRSFVDGKVSFESVKSLPIVQGKINNKIVYYIIDSGASLSCLDNTQAGDYKFYTYEDTENGSGVGYGGAAQFQIAMGYTATIGDIPLNIKFKAQNLSAIVNAIYESTGVKVIGIVGCDWLRPNKVIIDFNANELRK